MELILGTHGGDYTPEITACELPRHQINNVGKKFLFSAEAYFVLDIILAVDRSLLPSLLRYLT